jgi:hypothetical protein
MKSLKVKKVWEKPTIKNELPVDKTLGKGLMHPDATGLS